LAKLVTQNNRKISRISTRKTKISKDFPFRNFFVEKYPNFAKKKEKKTLALERQPAITSGPF
jgi:hypothetical protein